MATVEYLRTDPDLPPVGIIDRSPISGRSKALFALVAVVAAAAWAILALGRGETVNAVWIVLAAAGSYVIAYRFYARLIEYRVVKPRDDRATPGEARENGKDFLPLDRRVLFGHHFAAIAGAGPLVGPVLAAQMGYLPSTLWIVLGVIFAGTVQDYLVLWVSSKRGGRSLGHMARDELGALGGAAAIVGVLAIMVILLAVLGLVVVNALAASPWGMFSIAMTIPLALFMGVYLRYWRPGRVGEISLLGFVALLLIMAAGRWVAHDPTTASWFTFAPTTIAWLLVGYGFLASVLPVWLLLAPRDYLSTFLKIGTIALLAFGIVVTLPAMRVPAITDFARTGTGPAFAGSLFPFLFITIACGALSGFHALVSSGTTPKLLEKQSHTRMIGYGGMLAESFVAIMALITATIIDPHVYFAMNAPAGATGAAADTAAAYTNHLGLAGSPITGADLQRVATDVGEKSIVSRTGGAPTLAIGMSEVFGRFLGGPGMKAFWYHFAIMFEALFILTTVDAGTRVARFMFSDALSALGTPIASTALGRLLRKLRDPSWWPGAWLCSALVVLGWGSILVMGVTDPLGGINTLYPLFGIANQLLAAIALTVVTTIMVRQGMIRWAWIPGVGLLWDLVVTVTASWQKIFSGDPQVGYWKQHQVCRAAQAAGKGCLTAKTPGDVAAVVRNTLVQTSLSIVFVVLVLLVVAVACVVGYRSWRSGVVTSSELPEQPSRIFAPRGLIATAREKQLRAEWEARTEKSTDTVRMGSNA